MSLNQQNQLSAEERKKNREKFMIKDKENETVYRHYGELNGADFKLRKNKNCEIYILDWSKGMYIDDCEDCKIFCGPIDGSIFIRGSKNCQISIIARQVRFRNCENLKVFTYCPSDPAVESSFNIYFAPFNAFFPHLKELFVKGEFKREEKNHIDTPYDFTPSEELGGGAPHYLKLPEEEFFIKVIDDNNEPAEEMYDGYSQEEPWIQNKKSELPSFEQKANNDDNDFNFMNDNDNKKDNNEPKVQPVLNDFIMSSNNNNNNNNANEDKNTGDNNFMNFDDFLSGNNNNLLNQNNQNQNNNNNPDLNSNFSNNNFDNLDFNNNKNNNNNNFMDMNDFLGGNNNNKSQEKKDNKINEFNMNNMNNNQNNMSNNNFFNSNSNFNSFNEPNISKKTEEEMKLEEIKNKQKEMRQERIRQKIEKEAKMRMEIMAKASDYMRQFYEERKKRIAMNHEKLMQSSNQNNSNNNESPWGMVQSSFTGSTSSADRMKEVIMNKNKDQSK